jgi:DNA-binding transcriptional regulator YhcF (GntR family)
LRRQQRLIFRCVTAFMLALISRQIRKHDGDFTRALVYMAAVQASRPPPRVGGPADANRTFSVRAIAQSMRIPYETTRRKIADLEAAGLARRAGSRGYIVAPTLFEEEAYRADCLSNWQALQTLIAELRSLGFNFDAFGSGSTLASARNLGDADLVEATAVLANDFVLRVLESGVEPHGSILDSTIICVLIHINAELLTRDPDLARQYAGAETPPPDALRRPATITEVATSLGLTHETVRRRFRRYCQLGWARRVTGGYLYDIERMQQPEVLESGVMVSQRFLQLTQSLRLLGIDLDTFGPA